MGLWFTPLHLPLLLPSLGQSSMILWLSPPHEACYFRLWSGLQMGRVFTAVTKITFILYQFCLQQAWLHFAALCQRFPFLSASKPRLGPTQPGWGGQGAPSPPSSSETGFEVYKWFPKSLVLLQRGDSGTTLQEDLARRGHNRGGQMGAEGQRAPHPPPAQHGEGPV